MEQANVKVAALMTAPRHEITFARTCIQRALDALHIPLTVSGGVFYGQCMQKMLSDLCSKDCDYAVTIDYDTMFTAEQLQHLLCVIHTYEDIDAITGIQIRRGKSTMLGTCHGGEMVGEDEKRVFGDDRGLLHGRTAHFGLTVIDLKKLRQVPKPWFMSVPDENGEWDSGKIDDDVYFWLQWEKAGLSVWFDPSVRLGHLEEMVVMHDEKLQPVHLYPQEWELSCK